MFQFGGFNMMFPHNNRPFSSSYKCYSVSMLPGNERHDVEKGGKIIMPPSALDQLTRLNVEYPMLFKLTNSRRERITHAGVLEFVADEGKVYLPYWMMRNLLLEEGDMLQIESVSLPVATFSKFQPQNSDFLDITNPKAVLENALRNFACLTTGDLIALTYNEKIYELCVLETKPGSAVSIIECDMNVEFEAPVGYQEPNYGIKKEEPMPEEISTPHIEPIPKFSGEGIRLDGKKRKDSQLEEPMEHTVISRGIPDYDHPFGLLRFDRTIRPSNGKPQKSAMDEDSDANIFHGTGFSLKKGRK